MEGQHHPQQTSKAALGIPQKKSDLETPLDELIEKTYTALLSVVQTTAVSKKVLARPPFTFLHKLLVETLGQYGIFTDQQLIFSELSQKDDKAAFLTRALGFVTYTFINAKDRRVSCLLSVSPVRVLAGLEVEHTLEFLLQLCDVCKLNHPEAKAAAAQEVLEKGDAVLYTQGVNFRKGILTVQILVRTFVRRRIARRQKQGATPNITSSPLTASSTAAISASKATVGLKFLKEFEEFGVCEGVIKEIKCAGSESGRSSSISSNSSSENIFVLYYPQNDEEEEVNEKELQVILDESQRLRRLQNPVTSPSTGAPTRTPAFPRSVDEYQLNGLPDLSSQIFEQPAPKHEPIFTPPVSRGSKNSRNQSKRHSSIDLVTPKPRVSSLSRHATSNAIITATAGGGSSSIRPTTSGEQLPLSSNQSLGVSSFMEDLSRPRSGRDLEPIIRQVDANSDNHSNSSQDKEKEFTIEVPPIGEQSVSTETIKPWQGMLRNIMAAKTGGDQSSASSTTAIPSRSVVGTRPSPSTPITVSTAIAGSGPFPSFPKLSVPGMRPLDSLQRPATTRKKSKKQKEEGANNTKKNKPTKDSGKGSQPQEGDDATVGNNNNNNNNSHAFKKTSSSASLVDSSFATYQSSDTKSQAKNAMFRDIVRRIDLYMKRKHLRVIDLFRFCDADGNGSISPDEMIDTLSQMEIQLTASQAQDFITYIDKDGNGSIDIDEFEELIRAARRNEAQRDQLKKDFHHGSGGSSGRSNSRLHRHQEEIKAQQLQQQQQQQPKAKYRALIKHKQRIYDICHQLDPQDHGTITPHALRHALVRMEVNGNGSGGNGGNSSTRLNEKAIEDLIERSTTTSPSGSGGGRGGHVSIQELIKLLDDGEAKRCNRFLDQSWLSQFDSQLERAIREYELI